MKLKKIASLALAGMMAVSMLAACGNTNGNANSNGSSSTPTTDGETEVIPASTLVDLFNQKQDINNKVQITFTADSKLESAVKKAFEQAGGYLAATRANIPGYVKGQLSSGTDNNMMVPAFVNCGQINYTNLKSQTGLYAVNDNSLSEVDGTTKTFIGLYVVAGADDYAAPEATVNTMFAKLNPTLFANLPETYGTISPDQKYAAYSYTGSVCGMTTANDDGAPIMVVAVKITQTVNIKTGSDL